MVWITKSYGLLKSRGPFGRIFISLWDWVTRSYFQITLKVPFYQKNWHHKFYRGYASAICLTVKLWPGFSFWAQLTSRICDPPIDPLFIRAGRTVTRFLGQVVIYDSMIMRTCVQLITRVASKRIPNSKRKCFNFWNSSKSHFQTFNELVKKLNLEHRTE